MEIHYAAELVIALALGFAIDLIVGDPHGLVHPVQIIGWCIDRIRNVLERRIYGCSIKEAMKKGLERKQKEEERAGVILTAVTVAGTFVVVTAFLAIVQRIHTGLWFVFETLFIYQILATKSLKKESMKVYDKLKKGDLKGARRELSYLVGRDTQELDESEVAKADVETIAENLADGVIAPMFFIALGGAPLGFAYKAVNTLDSMVAYRNDELINIGRASAKLDDFCNFIPARLAAGMMIAASAVLKLDAQGAVRIFRRDRYNHLSPNSAQTEAVCAGALGIQLGGTHTYFGKPVEKPTIGDDTRPVEYEDIRRANRILYVSACFSLIVCAVLGAAIWTLVP